MAAYRIDSRFKIQELYLTTVKTHQDTYYKQLHKQKLQIQKNIYICICYNGKPAFHECRGDKRLGDISTAASIADMNEDFGKFVCYSMQ
jgi:hypothetical protein